MLTGEEKLEFMATIKDARLHGIFLESYSVEQQQIIYAIDEVGGSVETKMDAFQTSKDDD